jgi:hypothetical protein
VKNNVSRLRAELIKIEIALSFLDDPVKTPAGRQGKKAADRKGPRRHKWQFKHGASFRKSLYAIGTYRLIVCCADYKSAHSVVIDAGQLVTTFGFRPGVHACGHREAAL